MHIEKNRVVTLNYTLRDEQGTILDASSGRAPLRYLHGKGNIIPGLEQALAGKAAGDTLDVTVVPEQGYGPRDERLVQIVPRTKFQRQEFVIGAGFRMFFKSVRHFLHGHRPSG